MTQVTLRPSSMAEPNGWGGSGSQTDPWVGSASPARGWQGSGSQQDEDAALASAIAASLADSHAHPGVLTKRLLDALQQVIAALHEAGRAQAASRTRIPRWHLPSQLAWQTATQRQVRSSTLSELQYCTAATGGQPCTRLAGFRQPAGRGCCACVCDRSQPGRQPRTARCAALLWVSCNVALCSYPASTARGRAQAASKIRVLRLRLQLQSALPEAVLSQVHKVSCMPSNSPRLQSCLSSKASMPQAAITAWQQECACCLHSYQQGSGPSAAFACSSSSSQLPGRLPWTSGSTPCTTSALQ